MPGDDSNAVFAVGHQDRPDSSSEDSLSMRGLIRTGALRLAKEHVVTTEAGEIEQRFAPTDLHARELSAFSEEVWNRASKLPSGEDGVRLVTTALAVLRSLDTRQAVAVA